MRAYLDRFAFAFSFDRRPHPVNASPMAIKRRRFLGMGLFGFAGVSLPNLAQLRARAATGNPAAKSGAAIQAATEAKYWDRTDRFEEKMKLLEAAWQRKDFRLARALAHSLRSTAIQAQAEEESPGTPLLAAAHYETVDTLPPPWRNWATGWKYYKTLTLHETVGQAREREPIEILLSVAAEQVTSLSREVRI